MVIGQGRRRLRARSQAREPSHLGTLVERFSSLHRRTSDGSTIPCGRHANIASQPEAGTRLSSERGHRSEPPRPAGDRSGRCHRCPPPVGEKGTGHAECCKHRDRQHVNAPKAISQAIPATLDQRTTPGPGRATSRTPIVSPTIAPATANASRVGSSRTPNAMPALYKPAKSQSPPASFRPTICAPPRLDGDSLNSAGLNGPERVRTAARISVNAKVEMPFRC
jgi:hypothetical protein